MEIFNKVHRILKTGDEKILETYSKIYEKHRVLVPLATWYITGCPSALDSIDKEMITSFFTDSSKEKNLHTNNFINIKYALYLCQVKFYSISELIRYSCYH